jgi:hypothetical protein
MFRHRVRELSVTARMTFPRRGAIGLAAVGAMTMAATTIVAPAGSARADDTASASATAPSPEPPAAPVVWRPKLEIALGMGASFDGSGLGAAGVSAIPAFFAMGGFGDGWVGFDFGVFANSAIGRFRAPATPIDRLGLDGMLVLRPAARLRVDDARYRMRVLRSAALDVGMGFERASRIVRGPETADRIGFRVGAHVDIPLTAAARPGPVASGTSAGELRLRLGVRRLIGAQASAFPGGDGAADTRGEVFAALAAVF